MPHDWVGRLDLTRPAQWRNSLGEFHKKKLLYTYYVLVKSYQSYYVMTRKCVFERKNKIKENKKSTRSGISLKIDKRISFKLFREIRTNDSITGFPET